MEIRLRIALLALLLVASTSSAEFVTPTPEDERRALELLLPARKLAQQGRYADAIVAVEKARTRVVAEFGKPDHWVMAIVLYDLAGYKNLSKDFEGSHQSIVEATSIASAVFGPGERLANFAYTNAEFSYRVGRCNTAYESAKVAYENYLAAKGAQDSDTQRAALRLARRLLERGDALGALAIFDRTFPDENDLVMVPALLFRARLAMQLDNRTDADVWLQRASSLLVRSEVAQQSFGPDYAIQRARLDYANGDFVARERGIDALLADPKLPKYDRSAWLNALTAWAHVQGLKGQFADAQAIYMRVYDERKSDYGEESLPLMELHVNLGWISRMLGDFDRSEFHLGRALSAADSCFGPGSVTALYVLYKRSRLYLDMGRLNEALLDANRAEHDSSNVSNERDKHRSYALYARGRVLRRLGQLGPAHDDLLASEQLIREARGFESWDLAPVYIELADIALSRREWAQAQEWAQRALDVSNKNTAESMWNKGQPLAQLLEASAANERWAEVSDYGDRIVRIVDSRLGASQASSGALVQEMRRSRALIESLLDGMSAAPSVELSKRGTIERALAAAQLPHLTELTTALHLSDWDAGESTQLTKFLVERRNLLERLQTVQVELQAVGLGGSRSRAGDATAHLVNQSLKLELALGENDRLIREADPQAAGLLRPSLESLHELQALLADDEALYVQVVSGSRTHGVLLRSNGAWYRSSSLGRAVVRRNVSRLRRALDLSLPLARRLPFDYKAARDLYAGSIGLFEAELAGVSDITVVLDDAFQNLPSAVLVASEEGTGRTTFLGESFGLAVEPSVGTFKLLRTRASRQTASKPFVGFGDPILLGTSKDDSRSANSLAGLAAGASFDDLQQLPALPETAKELRQISKQLSADGAALYMQADATEANVKRLVLSDYRVVSFATHGLLAGQFRGLAQPALVLTPPKVATSADDGLLTASEIATLQLNADLVVLSACNTGRTDQGGGAAGLSALARGFFFAGADSIIVSHWAVSSEATVALISEVLRLMSSDSTLSKPQAMRRAMVSMMEGRAGEQFQDPAYWAPFVLLGDSRPLGR